MLLAAVRSRCHTRISVRAGSTPSMVFATMIVALLLCLEGYTQSQPAQQTQNFFPDTDPFVTRVAQHQKDLESLLSQYTYTDRITAYALDQKKHVRSQHTDTYYITPTAYEFFTSTSATTESRFRRAICKNKKKKSNTKYTAMNRKPRNPAKFIPRTIFCFPTSF